MSEPKPGEAAAPPGKPDASEKPASSSVPDMVKPGETLEFRPKGQAPATVRAEAAQAPKAFGRSGPESRQGRG